MTWWLNWGEISRGPTQGGLSLVWSWGGPSEMKTLWLGRRSETGEGAWWELSWLQSNIYINSWCQESPVHGREVPGASSSDTAAKAGVHVYTCLHARSKFFNLCIMSGHRISYSWNARGLIIFPKIKLCKFFNLCIMSGHCTSYSWKGRGLWNLSLKKK